MQFPADFHGCCSFCLEKKCFQAHLLLQVTVGGEKSHKLKEMLQYFLVSEFFKEFKKYLFI